MSKIGVFYGPSKGSVEKIAQMIANEFGAAQTELILIDSATAADVERFDKLIFGISTIGKSNWDSDYKESGWDSFMTKLDEIDWKKKVVAIFGLGDNLTYPLHFVDSIGWLYENLEKFDVKIVGHCDIEGYQFEESQAIRDGKFLGLPVDEDNEAELSSTRVSNWVSQLRNSGF